MEVWGRSPQLPEAEVGAKPLNAEGMGGLGAEPPALENFEFFLQK